MANLLIPGAAAAAGYLIGGPTGAQIGWLLGSSLSSGNNQEIEQPKIGDLRVQTSQYGVPIPFIIGKQRVAGNIIWADNKREYKIEESSGGGKGGGSETTVSSTGYTINMLIALCQGPILGVSRVWADGQLIIDSRAAVKPLIGQLYLGTMNQNPDPTYESIVGSGNAPAYRGLAYIALNGFDLGITGRIPQFSFEIIKEQII